MSSTLRRSSSPERITTHSAPSESSPLCSYGRKPRSYTSVTVASPKHCIRSKIRGQSKLLYRRKQISASSSLRTVGCSKPQSIAAEDCDSSDPTANAAFPDENDSGTCTDSPELESRAWVVLDETQRGGEQPCEPPRSQGSARSVLIPSVSLTLENSGSVARDHLASERTFLAYMRTSLAIASSGVALVQLFTVAAMGSDPAINARKMHAFARPLGAVTVTMGLVVLVIGVLRYFTVQTALTKGMFPVARIAISVIALALGVLIVLTFGILVAGRLSGSRLI